jgi:glutamate-1-semialdehyde 2,1-aminomutase
MTNPLGDYLKKWTPNGSQTRSKRDLPRPQGEYIDWIAALASVGLGYWNHEIHDAVIDQIERHGVASPIPTRLEAEVAELLCSVLKWPEQVRWVKTGSEATDGAMLIARAATGRRKVVSIGYHGWHLAHLPGPDLVTVPWGSQEFWDAIDCRTAGVLLEPMRDKEPPDDYFLHIKQRCEETGALLIIDEVVTGFRWAIGGATEYFHLPPPDLACYGKAMANGYALAGIVGKRGLMKYASEVSSTFGGEGVGLAAAKATIQIYQREPVIERLWEIGEQLMNALPELEGYPVHPHFPGEGKWGETSDLSHRAAEQGVLFHPSGLNPMYSHEEEDVLETVEVLRGLLDAPEGG